MASPPLLEVQDGPVVAIVSDGEAGPVPVALLAHDDLVVGRRMAEHVARDAALAPIALVAVALERVLEKVNVALEPMQFVVVHGRGAPASMGQGRQRVWRERAGGPRGPRKRAPAPSQSARAGRLFARRRNVLGIDLPQLD